MVFKIHVRDKEFISIFVGHPAGMPRVQQQDTMMTRIVNERSAEREHCAAALVAVQQRDPEFIRKQRIHNDVAINLVARTQSKTN